MSATLQPPAPVHEPHLLKFRLRQMFFVVTVVCLLCALAAVTSGPWPWVIGLTAVMVAAHVFGNLVGTRLRDTSEDVVCWRRWDPNLEPDDPLTTSADELAKLPSPANPNLANFGRLVRGLRWFVVGGGLAGFVLSATVLNLTIGYRIGWAGWTVGIVSGSVMGTWVAFLAVSFTTIARAAWRQAHGK